MTTVGVTTRQRFEDALRDYVAEITDGAILTEFFLISAATTVEDIGTGRTIYSWITPPTQAPHVSLGLIRYASDYGGVGDDNDD